MSCCRVIHPASGAVGECKDERSFSQNKKIAFRRLIEKPEFQRWFKIECSKKLGTWINVEKEIDREMRNIKIEAIKDGKWVKIKEEDILDDEN